MSLIKFFVLMSMINEFDTIKDSGEIRSVLKRVERNDRLAKNRFSTTTVALIIFYDNSRSYQFYFTLDPC